MPWWPERPLDRPGVDGPVPGRRFGGRIWQVCRLACPALATRALNLASKEATVVVLFGFCAKAEDVKRKTIAATWSGPPRRRAASWPPVENPMKGIGSSRTLTHRRSPWSFARLG